MGEEDSGGERVLVYIYIASLSRRAGLSPLGPFLAIYGTVVRTGLSAGKQNQKQGMICQLKNHTCTRGYHWPSRGARAHPAHGYHNFGCQGVGRVSYEITSYPVPGWLWWGRESVRGSKGPERSSSEITRELSRNRFYPPLPLTSRVTVYHSRDIQ